MTLYQFRMTSWIREAFCMYVEPLGILRRWLITLYAKLSAFKAEIQMHGVVAEYSSLEDLREQVFRHPTLAVRKLSRLVQTTESVEQLESQDEFLYDVFISFAEEDRPYAQTIAAALQRKGLAPYMSADMEPDFQDETRAAILASTEICVLCTRHSLSNPRVASEWGAAWILKRRIVPMPLEIEWCDLPFRLAVHQGRSFAELDRYVTEVETRATQAFLRHVRPPFR